MKKVFLVFFFSCLLSMYSIVFSQNYPLGNDTLICNGQGYTLQPFAALSLFEDSLVITYNASMGTTQLVGAAKVYMHAGYQEVPFGPIVSWVGNWGQDDGLGLMKSLGNNFWRITIHLRHFFNIPQGVSVNALAMVFRNEDGSQTGKDDSGNDIYLMVNTNTPNSTFNGVTGFIKQDKFQNILWNTGDSTATLTVNTSGHYSYQATDTNGVAYSDDIQVTYTALQLDLGGAVSLCGNNPVLLNAGVGFDTYLWNTGATSQSINVNTTGTYFVTIQTQGCSATDSIQVLSTMPGVVPLNLGNDTTICGTFPFALQSGAVLSPAGDSLTIIYNATMGQSQLSGVSKVYFHSGVQSVPSGPILTWIGNWGQDDGVGQMTNMGNNLWKITINIYNYYGLQLGTPVNALAMVFRNSDGSLTGKDDNNNDIYLQLGATPYSDFGGINATPYFSPYSAILWSTGDTVPNITVNTSGTYSVQVSTTNGCTMFDTIQVSMGNIPFIDAGSSQQICSGDSVVLDAGSGYSTYTWNTGDTTSAITVTTTGTYIINVTNTLGCIGADVVNIELIPSPQASFTYTSVGNGQVNFTSTATDALFYSWDFNADGVIDASTPNPSYQFPSDGTYNVVFNVSNNCDSNTVTIPVNILSSITTNLISNNIQLFPNPILDFLTIINKSNTQLTTIEIYDLTGKKLQTISHLPPDEKIIINLLPLSTGMYFIKISTSQHTQIFKINKS